MSCVLLASSVIITMEQYMRRGSYMKKAILFAAAVVTVLLTITGIAFAASPQDIYNDYATHGKLTQTYTPAELQAYLADATLDQYGDPAVLTALDGIAQKMLQGGGRGTFPFTGAQIALIAIVAVALVGGGFGLRRLSRSKG